jgi:hypothetical protein
MPAGGSLRHHEGLDVAIGGSLGRSGTGGSGYGEGDDGVWPVWPQRAALSAVGAASPPEPVVTALMTSVGMAAFLMLAWEMAALETAPEFACAAIAAMRSVSSSDSEELPLRPGLPSQPACDPTQGEGKVVGVLGGGGAQLECRQVGWCEAPSAPRPAWKTHLLERPARDGCQAGTDHLHYQTLEQYCKIPMDRHLIT